MSASDMMWPWVSLTFVLLTSTACAQTRGCQVELQLRKGVDSTSTYSIAQIHLKAGGKTANRKLNDCLSVKTEKPVVFDHAFINDICTCRVGRLRLAVVRAEPVDRRNPQNLVMLALTYQSDN